MELKRLSIGGLVRVHFWSSRRRFSKELKEAKLHSTHIVECRVSILGVTIVVRVPGSLR